MDDRSGGATRAVGNGRLRRAVGDRGRRGAVVAGRDEGHVVGCATCGVRAVGHGRSEIQVRDLPIAGRAVRLVWRKRRWLCRDPDCPTKTFTEASELVEGCLTRRAAREICRLVGEEGHSVASVARAFGVGWHGAMGCGRRHGRPLVDDARRLHGVRALGVDEHKMLAAGPTHHTVYATQLVDIDRHALLGRGAEPQCSLGVHLACRPHPVLL